MTQAALVADLTRLCGFAFSVIAHAHESTADGDYVKPAEMRSFLTEAAVVRIHVAWERYLEESFLEYLMGSPSVSGKVVITYLNGPSMDHARRVLVGTQRYVDWGNPEVVVQLANLYFRKGEPYSQALPLVQSQLLDFRTIRNAAAHQSSTAAAKLEKVALRWLGRAAPGVTAYDVVTAPFPRDPSKTILQSLVESVEATAAIVSQG